LQTYVGAEDKEKYLFLKERLTAGADVPDSQVLKLIINRLHTLEKEERSIDNPAPPSHTAEMKR
jgi:hypothetical protein